MTQSLEEQFQTTDVPTNEIVEIFASEEEKLQGQYNDANIKKFLSAMHHDGVVVLRDLIDPAHLDEINEFMLQDMERLLHKDPNLHQNFGKGTLNVQQGPTIYPTNLFFEDVYLNRLIFHAASLYLGPNPHWNFISGNTVLPGQAKPQPVHSDCMRKVPSCPFYVVANIPCIDATEECGATQVWLGGTHRCTLADQVKLPDREARMIKPEVLEARRKVQPGIQPHIPKGSVLLRDLRLWHAGMPNRTQDTRCMIGLGYSAQWYHDSAKFRIPADTGLAERIWHGTKRAGIIPWFHEVPVDTYLHMRNAHDFTFKERQTFEGEVF